MKWTCSHCGAINPALSFKCHNCPNTCGDETMNKKHAGHVCGGQVELADLLEVAIKALKRYENPEKWFTSFSGEECFILDEETFGNEVAQKALLEINKGFQPVSKDEK